MARSIISRKRTKIVCTIGPASGSAVLIGRLTNAGMNVARLNLSHGTHRDHARYIRTIRSVCARLGKDVAILMDLPGPKYRIGKLHDGKATLKKGARVLLTTRKVCGDAIQIPVSLPSLPRDVKSGDIVLLSDGLIQLKVLGIEGEEVKCRVIVGGVLTDGRGLVVPGMPVSSPFFTESLREHMLFALAEKPDFIALSFVSTADDITNIRNLLHEKNVTIPIIAKIERGQAVHNFESILDVSDGIMVARGDLGVDIPLEQVPLVQKHIIMQCNKAGKPVITATEMLESMVHSARPTRAEVTDVANAIYDGTDATMLSAETSIGEYPVQAVKIMVKIANEVEKKLPYDRMLAERSGWLKPQTDELIGYNACHTAHVLGAAAIVAFTESGSTPGRVSRYRPRMPILAITPSGTVAAQLLLRWGVHPVRVDGVLAVEELFATGVKIAKEMGFAKSSDLIVITGGIPVGKAGSTNLLKVERVV